MKNRPDFVELLFKRRKVARIHALDVEHVNKTTEVIEYLGGFQSFIRPALHTDGDDGDGGSEDQFYIYVSDNLEYAYQACRADRDGEHDKLGWFFGYPKCCIDAFVEYHDRKTADADNYWKPAVHDARKWPTFGDHLGGKFHYETIMSPELDVLPFFPCSFGCQEAREIAKFRWVLKDRDNSPQPTTMTIDGTELFFDIDFDQPSINIHMGA